MHQALVGIGVLGDVEDNYLLFIEFDLVTTARSGIRPFLRDIFHELAIAEICSVLRPVGVGFYDKFIFRHFMFGKQVKKIYDKPLRSGRPVSNCSVRLFRY